MSLKDLIKQAGSLVYEADETKTATPAKPTLSNVPHPAFNLPSAPAVPVSTGGFGAAPAASPFAVPSTTVLNEKVYQSVLNKTNFNTTTVGKAIMKYYDALEGVIADQSQRFRAAVGQAQKLDNITPDQVLSTFDQMSAALEQDAQQFAAVAAQHDKAEIQTRQNSIASKQQQVTQLNAEIAQLTTELADETSRSTEATTQHNMAHDRRAQEIAGQKAQVASLLR